MSGVPTLTLSPDELAALEAAMRSGASDKSLARPGLCRGRLRKMRAGWGIKPLEPHGVAGRYQRRPGTRPKKPDSPTEAKMRVAYRRGCSDYETADIVGVERWRVQMWRNRWGLAANFVPNGEKGRNPRPLAKRIERVCLAWRDPLYSACRKAVGSKLSPDIVDDAVSSMIVDVLEGELAEADIANMGRRYGSRSIQQWADRRGPASLDEDRNGEGWTRYASTPDADAEQPFRVVELVRLAELRGIDWRAALA